MLVRIVRMVFKPENVGEFLTIFEQNKTRISTFPGCKKVSLHQDVADTNVYYTHSHWTDSEALAAYRHSEMFQSIWQNTKVLFAEKPLAFSFIDDTI